MANRKVRAIENENWKPVRGVAIPGILFELDTITPRLRIKRGRHIEIIDLSAYGFQRLQCTNKKTGV